MKKTIIQFLILLLILSSCGSESKKKRGLDSTLFKYAAVIRWSNFDAAVGFLKPGDKNILPSGFDLERLKQFKVSSYQESPITPGHKENVIHQAVEIQLYNIHNNKTRTIIDNQIWEFDTEHEIWFLTSGIPEL
ncbi:MAG TPA: hypothetical protein PLO83_07625 [Gammaproteobacteria bacterium]|nr:hypothetical protein [Gammaproteobacteria bacterium]